jgi:RsiW-degrading membrane proteinase PrsW (M82 family)
MVAAADLSLWLSSMARAWDAARPGRRKDNRGAPAVPVAPSACAGRRPPARAGAPRRAGAGPRAILIAMSQATLIGLAIVAPVVAFYFAALRWADRFEPEPLWLVVVAFAWGAVVAAGGAVVGIGLAEASLQAVALPRWWVEATSDTVIAPLLEETLKGFGLVLLFIASRGWLRELDGPLDGLVYGAAIGLGFTLTEDVLYVRSALAESGFAGALSTTFVRTVLMGLAHCTYGAMTGLGFGVAAERRGVLVTLGAPAAGFVAAVSVHALHNVLASYGKAQLFDTVLFTWAVDVAFFVGLALLVVRERGILVRELGPEVGELLTRAELDAITSYLALDRRLIATLFRDGPRAYFARSEKQRLAVKLAFVKHRRRLDPGDPRLAEEELAARDGLRALEEEGVRLVSSPPSR